MMILIAALAVCGVFLIAWAIFEALLMPLPERDTCMLVYLHGDVAQVQQCIRACRWLRERRGVRGQMLFVDRGLTPEGRQSAVRMMSEEPSLFLCADGEEYTILEKWKRGAGTD